MAGMMAVPLSIAPPRDLPDPPDHLSEPMQEFYGSVLHGYDLTEGAVELLRRGCELWDLGELARLQVLKDGPVVQDRFGQDREHPAAKTFRDCTALFMRILRELQLEPPATDSRPTRLY